MKKTLLFFVCCLMLLVFISCGKKNAIPDNYSQDGQWFDGASIIKDTKGTQYYLDGDKAYKISKGTGYEYYYDEEDKVYVPMSKSRTSGASFWDKIDENKVEERIPYVINGTILVIPDSVTTIKPNFYITSVKVSANHKKFALIDNALYDKETKTLIFMYLENEDKPGYETIFKRWIKKYEIPEGILSIGAYAIKGGEDCDLHIPSSLTHIDMDAFNNCKDTLYSISFDTLNPKRDFNIENDIIYNYEKTKIIFANFQEKTFSFKYAVEFPDTLLEIPARLFYKENDTVNLPDSIETIGESAFEGFYEISNYEGIFSTSASSTVKINKIPKNLKNIGKRAFRYATFKGNIEIPNGVEVIPSYAFDNIRGAKESSILSSVKEIQYSAFNGARDVQKVIIAEGVEIIASSAFSNMPSLEEINIPSSVTTLENGVFSGSPNVRITISPESPIYDKVVELYGNRLSSYFDWL